MADSNGPDAPYQGTGPRCELNGGYATGVCGVDGGYGDGGGEDEDGGGEDGDGGGEDAGYGSAVGGGLKVTAVLGPGSGLFHLRRCPLKMEATLRRSCTLRFMSRRAW